MMKLRDGRGTFVMRGGKLVRKDLAGPRHVKHGRAAYVISDDMPAAKHMATGRTHTSKRGFAADTRATACVEVGTEKMRPGTPPPPPSMVPYVQRAIAQLESR